MPRRPRNLLGAAFGCLLASASAWGQGIADPAGHGVIGPLPNYTLPSVVPTVMLSLPIESTMLIVQTLGQIQCATVTQMATCFKASDLLKDIQNQVKAQQK